MKVFIVIGKDVFVFAEEDQAVAFAEENGIAHVHERAVQGGPKVKVKVLRAEAKEPEESEFIQSHPPGQPPANRVPPPDLLMTHGLRLRKCDYCENTLPAGGSSTVCARCIAGMVQIQAMPRPNGPAAPTPGAEMM